MRIDPKRTFAALATLLSAEPGDSEGFGPALAAVLATLVRFDHLVAFGYVGDARPVDLFDTFDPAERVVFVEKYQEGPYLLDPFFRAAREPRPGFHRMRDLAPDRFFSSEYFRSYYVETGLAEEVGYFCPVGEDAAVVVSLMRRHESGAFSRADVDLLAAAEPVVAAVVRRRFADLPARAGRRRGAGGRGGEVAGSAPVWRDLGLTPREAAVVDLVLQGHSSDSIARRMDIAPGTVKVHRRNVYRKLNITSQTQLLSVYLDTVTRAAPLPPAAPSRREGVARLLD